MSTDQILASFQQLGYQARHVVITDVNEYRLELARKMGATPRRQRQQRETY